MGRTALVAVLALLITGTAFPVYGSSSSGSGETDRILFDAPVERGSGTDFDIFLMDADGAGQKNITDRAWNQQNAAWAPDGRSFSMKSAGEIHVTSPSARKLRRVVRVTQPEEGLWWLAEQSSWSRDGEWLVYTMYEYDEFSMDPDPTLNWSGIGIARSHGPRQRVLIPPQKGMTHYDPSFSPDGDLIVFSRYTQRSDDTVTVDILSMRSDGSEIRNLTAPSDGGNHRPRWTSDGRIMFISDRTCQWAPCSEIYVMDPDGTDVEQLTTGPHDWGGDGFPDAIIKISPDPGGSRVIVTVMTGPPHVPVYELKFEVWMLDLTTGERRLLLPDSTSQFEWRPVCTVQGTPAGDILVGTKGKDLICGLGGNDVIRGLGGDDAIFGHAGDDRIVGGAGSDIIVGNGGRDRCDRDESDHSRVC